MSRALIALLGLLLLGCQSNATRPEEATELVAEVHVFADDGPPEALRAASGFDPAGGHAGLEPGARLLYRVRLQEGRRHRSWYVEMKLAGAATGKDARRSYRYEIDGAKESIESPMWVADVTLAEHGSSKLRSSRTFLPERFLEQGLYEICRLNRGRSAEQVDAGETHEQKQRHMGGWMSLIAFLQVIMENKDLSSVLWAVIKKPSMLGVLLHGTSIMLSPEFETVQLEPSGLPQPLEAMQAWRLPVHIDVNGTRALETTLLVCPPDPPLRMAAGLIRLEGVHPEHADRRVWIELVGARGPEPSASAPLTP